MLTGALSRAIASRANEMSSARVMQPHPNQNNDKRIHATCLRPAPFASNKRVNRLSYSVDFYTTLEQVSLARDREQCIVVVTAITSDREDTVTVIIRLSRMM